MEPIIINLQDMEIPFTITNREILDLTFFNKVNSMEIALLNEQERKDLYFEFMRCVNTSRKSNENPKV
jgi:hypothetical protein